MRTALLIFIVVSATIGSLIYTCGELAEQGALPVVLDAFGVG